MRKSQITVVAIFSILLIGIGLFLSWPAISSLFLGLQNTDSLFNFVLDIVGFIILIAIAISFFVWNGVELGR